ncbi:hypothetical protein T492DRAFT_933512 [Pavlovales sp. CCMP2436]|nr:hypothetical protein T492DRAFT_933512 [Pavlovales sp. CCMP2436]
MAAPIARIMDGRAGLGMVGPRVSGTSEGFRDIRDIKGLQATAINCTGSAEEARFELARTFGSGVSDAAACSCDGSRQNHSIEVDGSYLPVGWRRGSAARLATLVDAKSCLLLLGVGCCVPPAHVLLTGRPLGLATRPRRPGEPEHPRWDGLRLRRTRGRARHGGARGHAALVDA